VVGSPGDATLVKNLNPDFNNDILARDFEIHDGILYFTAILDLKGQELVRTDGTDEGTYLVKELRSGVASSEPDNLTSFNGYLYFQATDGTNNHGHEIWRTDGTENGTVLFADIKNPGSSDPDNFVVAGSKMFFTADDGITDALLFYTDGVTVTPVISKLESLKEIDAPVDVQESVYFGGGTVSSEKLWRTDGTACHTLEIEGIPPTENFPSIKESDGYRLLFTTSNNTENTLLWTYVSPPVSNTEICNGIDDDCNSLVDDNALTAAISPSGTVTACKGTKVTLIATNEGYGLSYQWKLNEIPSQVLHNNNTPTKITRAILKWR
jgi:ELWxxDGT repeat protein